MDANCAIIGASVTAAQQSDAPSAAETGNRITARHRDARNRSPRANN